MSVGDDESAEADVCVVALQPVSHPITTTGTTHPLPKPSACRERLILLVFSSVRILWSQNVHLFSFPSTTQDLTKTEGRFSHFIIGFWGVFLKLTAFQHCFLKKKHMCHHSISLPLLGRIEAMCQS